MNSSIFKETYFGEVAVLSREVLNAKAFLLASIYKSRAIDTYCRKLWGFCFVLLHPKVYFPRVITKTFNICLCVASNNAMAERQGSGRVTVWAHWILAITLMLWGHRISGQGQGKSIFFFLLQFSICSVLHSIGWKN